MRYFDGVAWTAYYLAPPSMPGFASPSAIPAWKGAQLGLPKESPGSLANPGRRLAARALDALVLLPIFAAICALAIGLVAPHAGPMFPALPTTSNSPERMPGFVWLYITVLGAIVATGLLMVIYEGVATARYGRTLGKAWMGIRPVRTSGTSLSWARSFGRVGTYFLASFLSWLGLLDPLWCLWDKDQQCLHDKVADTVVINDMTNSSETRPGTPASPR
jgi:uncharacterized RDD family membrane protein YckC